MGLLSTLFGRGKKQSPDEWAIAQLKKGGADISKPHQLEFQMRFPTKTAAEEVLTAVKAAGYGVLIEDDTPDAWLLKATRTMILDAEALSKIHGELDELAGTAGGHYAGWGTAAEE